ncbi:MAG: transporter related protein [Frankiales bacterium]|nr:transporter related protein [Frankiales bacterium]
MSTATGPLLQVRDRARGDLEVPHGGVVVLLAPSGGGKTQWVRALLGLDGGRMDEVRVDGRKADTQAVRKAVGWVPEGDGAVLDLTVWDNVACPPHLPPVPHADAADALDLLGLTALSRHRAWSLSRNDRRRVALARVVARRNPLLVVDGDLDATLMPLLLPLLEQAPGLQGVLLTSSRAGDLAWRAGSVGLMLEGRVLEQAPWAELVTAQRSPVRDAVLWVQPQ